MSGWKKYIEGSASLLYSKDLPLKNSVAWALYDLREFVPPEFHEKWYSPPKEPRPGAKSLVLQGDEDEDEDVDIGEEQENANEVAKSKEKAEQERKTREEESFLLKLMFQIAEQQKKLALQ